jgi:transcriptional regulator with XRE-family HTH domain
MINKTSRKYYRDEELLIKIGNNIKKTREEKCISLSTLAYRTNIGYSHLKRIELGKVNFRVSYLYRLAGVLGIEAGELLP